MGRAKFIPRRWRGCSIRRSRRRLSALIAEVRARARADLGVAPKLVVAPHAGIVYSGSVAATAFGPWARRAEPPKRDRHRRSRAPLRLSAASRFIPRRAGRRRSAKLRSPRDLHERSPRLPAVASTRGRSPASIRSKCTSSCCRRCCRRRSRSCRSWSATPTPARRRRGVAARLGRAGDGRLSISSDLSHFLDQKSARVDRRRHRPTNRDVSTRRR